MNIIPKRICDSCGKEKSVKGGKVCSTGHFICSTCVGGGIIHGPRKTCPICGKKLK